MALTISRRGAAATFMLMIASMALVTSQWLREHLHATPVAQVNALDLVPLHIGSWTEIPDTTLPVNPARLDALGRPGQVYDKIVSRTYIAPDGTQIMMMLAYQREQHQEDRVHSPELCYVGQGFVLEHATSLHIPVGNISVPMRSFTGTSLTRDEEVLYMIRTGRQLKPDSFSTRWEIFSAGIKGRIDDGILMRVSTTNLVGPARSVSEKQALLARFVERLYQSVPGVTQLALIGQSET